MYWWWEYKMAQTLWKSIQWFLKKLKRVPPQDPTEKKKPRNQKNLQSNFMSNKYFKTGNNYQ